MVTALRAKKLLQSAATTQDSMRKKINKKEISKKIDEIKYLSTQKNVPRLSLRKEIVHLEKKLEHIFLLEEKLLKNDQRESKKVASLKRQINNLKNRLNATEDKELRGKVTKLYHILTELLAKSELKKDVALSEALLKELQNVAPEKPTKQIPMKIEENVALKIETRGTAVEFKPVSPESKLKVRRASMLLHRIKSVKHELELKAELMKTDPEQLNKIKKKIAGLEIKIQEIQRKYPDVKEELQVMKAEVSPELESVSMSEGMEPAEVKHTMMMGAPTVPSVQTTTESGEHMSSLESKLQTGGLTQEEEVKIEDEVIGELPLPPPPKIRKK